MFMKSGVRAYRTESRKWMLSVAGVGLLLWLGACGSQPAQEEAPAPAESAAPAAAGPERHPLHGKVVAVDKDAKSVVVDHDAIPDFMDAMAMPYPVRDESALDTLKTGDEVNAEVVVDDTGMHLENIQVVQGQ